MSDSVSFFNDKITRINNTKNKAEEELIDLYSKIYNMYDNSYIKNNNLEKKIIFSFLDGNNVKYFISGDFIETKLGALKKLSEKEIESYYKALSDAHKVYSEMQQTLLILETSSTIEICR